MPETILKGQRPKLNVRQKYNRQSVRLKGYDYASQGVYFITVCTHNKQCLFGEITNQQMQLNELGNIVCDEWSKTKHIRDNVKLDEFIIMPNHLHGIMNIVGAHPCVRPNWMHPCVRPNNLTDTTNEIGQTQNDIGQTHGSAPTIGRMIQWFKTMSTNEYIRNVKNNHWQPFNKHLWQRNYYEHVVRGDNDLNRIRQYIIDNPKNWDNDKENPLATYAVAKTVNKIEDKI